MTITQHRERIGITIIIAHLSIFIIIIFLYGIGGYTTEEFGEIMKFLIPVKSIYLTALVKFVVDNKKSDRTLTKANKNTEQANKMYLFVTNIFILSHIALLTFFILAGAFNLVTFAFLLNALTIIETFFGAYIGIIISDMFASNKTS